ncbi:hypothetical protein vBYenM636_32 [Yersinia phage vB_YenM_636]|nr:hypothetical protein X1_25 [Yersinia phage vB_Yen_X1]QKN86283.1 hypothetical protein vBYenM12_32 [Yersinia phage vB_YenM_12]QKN86374.1 hypothetical protein vBYenM22_32 [Yersinia phage vB_YenM_22]QKN86465.1 hypothetical protein vBYenM25_32 [Yersinia phage vB_YenM_25]QKN86556.1 hypothetical protein vBYenM27_32 [Yersinia phage vB_YenM_27]QKN86647.1 hypothetical protein vBYenM39_32 [Yersinia phage vB_YenM_39]QKN86738.1 hypothetical protein vBYenM126_32 [Yersinia phage vB_YenM_126]QKN86829.1 h
MATTSEKIQRRAKEHIKVAGREWRLRRDAFDPTTSFPHERVTHFLDVGCSEVGAGIYSVWVVGLITPTQGTLERPVQVMYLGFANRVMAPSREDLGKMHVYTCDSSTFAADFVSEFLSDGDDAVTEKPVIMPYPENAAQNGEEDEE